MVCILQRYHLIHFSLETFKEIVQQILIKKPEDVFQFTAKQLRKKAKEESKGQRKSHKQKRKSRGTSSTTTEVGNGIM
jgi:hypothetical protein